MHVGILIVLLGVTPTSPPVSDNWFNDFIGPYAVTPDGRTVSAGAEYWTGVVGVAFDRDIELSIPPTPLDLDLDRMPDTTFSGRWTLPGGILANPEKVGLIPTPEDPRGTVGTYSVSTGFVGVREELDPTTKRGTGRYAFNCMLCHAGADETGRVLIGRPNPNIHLGLIMATSNVMDESYVIRWPATGQPVTPDELRRREGLDASFDLDPDGNGKVTIAEWRIAMRMAPVVETQAALLLGGPGRLDQSIDPRMDGAIPLANLQRYWMAARGHDAFLRMQKRVKRTAFNPVSLPASACGIGVEHYSWTGKDSSQLYDAAGGVEQRLSLDAARLARLLEYDDPSDDPERLNRVLTLDFRNVGTFSREVDFNKGADWMTTMLRAPSETLITETPPIYGAFQLRDLLTHELPSHGDPEDPLIEKGRRIFTERETGTIINQRIVQGRAAHGPPDYRGVIALAPIDRSKGITERIPVRCATCHNYSPMSAQRTISTPLESMQRCDICHYDHPDPRTVDNPATPLRFVSLVEHMRSEQLSSVEGCLDCHKTHPDFGPQVYSNSWLLPFDANANGLTHGDQAADGAAGGIGTDPYLAIDSLFSVQLIPPDRRPREPVLVSDDARRAPAKPRYVNMGFGWVRVAPLISLGYTAPFLHNGSVPTLNDLLLPASQRPQRFPVGHPAADFTFDAALKGNLNCGHEFGASLAPEDRKALVRFLKSLP